MSASANAGLLKVGLVSLRLRFCIANVGQGSLTWLQGLTELIVSGMVKIYVFLESFLY